MISYLLRRLAGGVAVFAALLVFAFLATHFVGDPVAFLTDPELNTKEEVEALRKEGGFDRPAYVQLAGFLGDVARGDLGTSIWQNRPASEIVLERIPATLQLAGVTLLLTFAVAIPLSVVAARGRGGPVHACITTVTTILASVPAFWVALAFIFLFAVQWKLLPTSGYGWGVEMILPVAALSLAPIGRYTQVLETAIAEEFRRPYVSTARAKGLKERTVVRRHVLRNAAIVGITLLSAEVITLLNGAVLVEQVYAWPGVGQVLLDSVLRRDLPVVMAGVVYIGAIVIVVNLLADIAYAAVDPRVRFS